MGKLIVATNHRLVVDGGTHEVEMFVGAPDACEKRGETGSKDHSSVFGSSVWFGNYRYGLKHYAVNRGGEPETLRERGLS